jgi:hypothetical protein
MVGDKAVTARSIPKTISRGPWSKVVAGRFEFRLLTQCGPGSGQGLPPECFSLSFRVNGDFPLDFFGSKLSFGKSEI